MAQSIRRQAAAVHRLRPAAPDRERRSLWGRTVNDSDKTRSNLLRENERLRLRVVALEAGGADVGGRSGSAAGDSSPDAPAADGDVAEQATTTLQRELQTWELHYQAVVEALPDLLFRIKDDGTFLDFVPAKGIDTLMPPGNFLGRRIADVMPGEVAVKCMANMRRALETGRPQVCDYRLERDGRTSHYEARFVVCGPREVVAIVRDFTERRQADEQIRFQAQLLDSVRESIVATDLSGRVTYWGKGAEALYGHTAVEVLGKPITMIVKPEDADEEIARTQRVLEVGAWKGQYVQQRKDGSTFWADTARCRVVDASGRPCGMIGIDRDVTEAKLSQDKLREAEQRYRTLFNQSPDAVVIVDPNTMLPVEFNDVALRLLGYTRQEFAKVPFSTHEIMETPEEIRAHIERIVRDGVDEFDTKLRTRDGRVKEILADVRAVELSGRVVFHSVLHDITERKRTEEKLRRSEEHLRLALKAARVGTWEWDIDSNQVHWSDGVEKIFGLPTGSFERSYEAYLALILPEDRAEVEARIARAMEDDKPYAVEHRISWPDGSIRWLAGDGRVLRDAAGRAVSMAGTVMDITQRKTAEADAMRLANELAHVARVSTMGEMAAGLAHELNQPLTVISGYARDSINLIESGELRPRQLVDPLQTIARQAERAGEIIRRLWNLISKGETRRSALDVNAMIDEISDLIGSEARQHGTATRCELAEGLRPVCADAVQIQQVILNLVRNACESMVGLDPAEREVVVRTAASEAGAVVVTVSDVGSGIKPDVFQRIFEPFYSTKPDGLGMGLTISRSIIDNHGGHLSAGPNPDRGTTFEFVLPAEPAKP